MHAAPTAVDVWWIPVLVVDCASLLPLLHVREREMSAHVAVRSILGTYLVAAPTDVRISWASTGKRVLDGAACSVHFSMAKPHLFGLLAVSTTPVGVDVEVLKEGGSLSESSALPLLRSERQSAREWPAREAYAKLTGLGIVGVESGPIPATVRCGDVPAPPGYIATLATHPVSARTH